MKLAAILCSALLLLTVTHAVARDLSEQQARAKAAAILKGDPYGPTAKVAASRIRRAQLINAGTTDCGRVTKPVWQFHVTVPANVVAHGNEPIDGYLVLDAPIGKAGVRQLAVLGLTIPRLAVFSPAALTLLWQF